MRKILYVNNVSQMEDLCAIEDLLLTVGDVIERRFEVIPESGQNSSFGVFEMSTEQQAFDCVERFHGHVMAGKSLSIKSGRPTMMSAVKSPRKG